MRFASAGAGLLASLALVSLCAAQDSENFTGPRQSDVGPASPSAIPEALGTVVAGPFDIETGPFDNRCLGVEEAWGHFWVTGRGHTTTGDNYQIHKYDMSGTYLGSYPQVTASTGWAGRDMEADEIANLLWVGSDNSEVSEYSYDPTTGGLTHIRLITVAASGTVRALCQDTNTGNFYTKSFTSSFYEFDLVGGLFQTVAASVPSAYGFGWDWVSGTIWSSDNAASATEIDTGCVATGNGFATTLAGSQGGADVYEDSRNPGFLSMVMLHQTTPDSIVVYDLAVSTGGIPCTPPVVYCTAAQGTSSGGCVASIATSNMALCPVDGADDYDVIVSGCEDYRNGVIFYGFGQGVLPFWNGTLCVAQPYQRTPVQNTGGGGGGGCFTDRNAWLTAIGAPTHTEDFSGFTVDTPFDPTVGGTGPVALNGCTIEVLPGGGAAFRNIVDVPPFQFGDNNGTNNCSSFTNWDEPTEIHVIPSAPVGAYGCGISQGLGLEMVEMACMAGGSTMYVCAPGSNTIDAFTGVVSGTLLDQIVYRSQTYSAGSGGEGFGLDGLEMVVGPVAGGCSGSMTLRINDPAGVNFVAGTVVNYQGWYRDPPGVGADLSDAVEVEYK